MNKPYKKKLIEVAIPLEAINAASAREKSIRHGHPSTLHLWWARRPLAACRAVLFAQLVDDPSSRVEELLADPKLRPRAEAELPERVEAWKKSKASAKGAAADVPQPTLDDVVVEIERKRLFAIIEELVIWENSTNEEVLERARAEIRRSTGGHLPPVYDPFSGGGSIPLEAQRLGLPAFGSDLNPVAVMIGKAMIEIPPKFKDMAPIHPGVKERQFYRNAEGLAEDVRYYGTWMREKAWERIGHLYPQADLPTEYGGGKATVIAWIWARTVPSPDPAFSDCHVPLAASFLLSSKKGKTAWVEPVVDKLKKTIRYEVRCQGTKLEIEKAKDGTKAGRAMFRCLYSDAPISGAYIEEQAKAGLLSETLLAVVADSKSGRVFLEANDEAQAKAIEAANQASNVKDTSFLEKPCRGTFASNAQGRRYNFHTFADYYTPRQRLALATLTELVPQARALIQQDLKKSVDRRETSIHDVESYASAICVYLAFAIGRTANTLSTLARWTPERQQTVTAFSRQAISMTWDFPEVNPFASAAGDFGISIGGVIKGLFGLGSTEAGSIIQCDAQSVSYPRDAVICTDPPYYDNVAYADLSDYFFCWMREILRPEFPDLFSVLSTPKSEELVAVPFRHSSKDEAESFFLNGMREVVSNMALQSSSTIPATIFYAFKQSEIEKEGISSTGWATFLQAVVEAGYSVVGTWPIRTEMANRMIASGTNALANSVVLVCRKKDVTADAITRAEFIRSLKRELPPAIAELQAANIAPADMPQSAIGPGMGVFSRYKSVLEADDSPMTVKTALQLINAELDEYLGGIQGEFDPDTRFAITWFEQNGMSKGDYGVADNLARARGISVDSVKHAGIVESAAGKVRLLSRDELDPEWEPTEDSHLTIWECLQHLVGLHENDGLSWETIRMMRLIGSRAEAAKDLAYCLYDIAANKRKDAKEATAYNAIIADWTEMSRQAAKIHDTRRDGQAAFDL